MCQSGDMPTMQNADSNPHPATTLSTGALEEERQTCVASQWVQCQVSTPAGKEKENEFDY